MRQRSGFVSLPRTPPNVLNVQPAGLHLRHFVRDQCCRLVGGVVKHLNDQFLTRIIKLGDGLQKALDHVHFVVNGKLNRD